MHLPGQIGRRGHNVLHPFVGSFVCYQTCEHDILKMNEAILMPVGTNGPHKMINFGVRRSKMKVRRGGHLSETSFSTPLGRVGFSRAMLCTSATCAVVQGLSGVCHVRVLRRNGYGYGHTCYGMRIGNRHHLMLNISETVRDTDVFFYYHIVFMVK